MKLLYEPRFQVKIRLCEPCQYLDDLTTKGLLAGLIHRGGLRADIILGGTIRVGGLVTENASE
jgi:hypothetical protein